MEETEATSEAVVRHDGSTEEGTARSDCAETPAVEGLLLLQHGTERLSFSGVPKVEETLEQNKTVVSEIDRTAVNPIQQLLKKGTMLRIQEDIERMGRFRGVFPLPSQRMYYSIIDAGNRFHFLGFHASAAAAAQAWDLAAMKRAMDMAQNLSAAKTNFRLEDYVRLEHVLTLMVVLSFDELVEMFKEMHGNSCTSGDLHQVQTTMDACRVSFEEELGTVPIPPDEKEDPPLKTQTLSADEMRDLISSTSGRGAIQNLWVKNIRDSKKWKGVYFSRDGVPYSKVEFGGKYHYLGRFDTLEGAARAYDLATLKRAMSNHQSTVLLNFPKEDYIKDRQLMEFLYVSDSEQVSSFIRMLAHQQRANAVTDHYDRGRSAYKRQKLNAAATMACMQSWGRKPAESSLQRIDWDALELGKSKMILPGTGFGEAPGAAEDGISEMPKKQEMRVERRICDGNMAALLRDSHDWVRVALNAVALKMTHTNITVASKHINLPVDVAEWFGSTASEAERRHAVELTNACGEQSFHFICYVSKDSCRFSATAWNQFVDEIGLTVGDILVLLKSTTLWKLSYAVFVLPDAVVADAISQSVLQTGRKPSKMPTSMFIPPPAPIRPAAPQAPPAKRTLQAHLLPSTENLANIQVLHKTNDGRLLVEASLIRCPTTGVPLDPSKRYLFVVPDQSYQAASIVRPLPGFGMMGQSYPNKRLIYNTAAHPLAATSPQPRPQRAPRPACLPSVPIRLNIRGGAQAPAKKSDASLYMVADAKGQMRLVTSQPPHSAVGRVGALQPVNYAHPPEADLAMGYPCHYYPNDTAQRSVRSPAMDRISHTSPEITVIDPSTTGSDASGTGTEKPMHEEQTSQKNVIDLVEDEKDSEKQGDNLPDMYTRIMKIIEDCEGLDADDAKKYKFAFVNKMTEGQQIANFMELKNLSHAGEWREVAEWIKNTI